MTQLPSAGFSVAKFGVLTLAALCAALPLSAQTAPASTSAPAATPKEEPITLDVFVVNASADKGYLSTSSLSASRINTPIANIPQSLVVITQEMVRDQAPTGLGDILRFAPGVSVSENNGEAVSIRGFGVSIPLQDGFRFPRGFPSEQADVERVEVLLGPASVLYGNVFGVSGVINRITKKPQFTPATSLQLQFKDQDGDPTKRFVFDTTGPFGQSEKLAYRLIVAGQDADFAQDFSNLSRLTIYPRVSYQFTKTTKLDFGGEYSRQTGGLFNNSGVNFDYVLKGNIIRTPANANPDQDFVQSEVVKRGATFTFTSSPIDHWSFRVAGLGYWVQTQRYQTPTNASINADGMTIRRNTGGNIQKLNRGTGNMFFQADASGDYAFKGITLKPILGLEYGYDSDGAYQTRATTALPAFNFFAPDYTTPLPTSFVFAANPRTNTMARAAYGIMQTGFWHDRIILSAGTRVTNFVQTSRIENATTRLRTKTRFESETHTVPRYGVVFKVLPDISTYYSYSEGYQPATGSNPDGTSFPPITGQQKEFGVKASLFNGRLVSTLARFKLDRVNALQADLTRPGYRIPVGSEEAAGYDMSLIASLTGNWQLIAGAVKLTDSKVTGSATATQVGLERTGFAELNYNLWTRYSFTGKFKGLSIGAGLNFVDDTPVALATSTAAAVNIPAYTIYNAMVSYDWNKKIRFQFNMHNIEDERYYPDGGATRFLVGQPRTLSGTVTYKF